MEHVVVALMLLSGRLQGGFHLYAMHWFQVQRFFRVWPEVTLSVQKRKYNNHLAWPIVTLSLSNNFEAWNIILLHNWISHIDDDDRRSRRGRWREKSRISLFVVVKHAISQFQKSKRERLKANVNWIFIPYTWCGKRTRRKTTGAMVE